MIYDYIIVGSGLTGAVISHILKNAGKRVLVLERRNHVGGNVHDHTHPSGIRIHTYGPHYFRTNDDGIWKFVRQFSDFYNYEAIIKSHVDANYENWPIAGSYIRKAVGENWQPKFKGAPENFEQAALALMPGVIYEKFVKGYTEKQWGVPAVSLSSDLVKRFNVHEDDDPRLMSHKHQGIPIGGYAEFMSNMLSGTPVLMNVDYLRHKQEFNATKKVIFTGPIDEYFHYDLGRLKYRGQKREHQYSADAGFVYPCGQVNFPSPVDGPQIRTLEWKHMMPPEFASRIRGSVLTTEITFTPDDPTQYEYPFPDEDNSRLYSEYRLRAEKIEDALICGRLGEYRYYDMDHAIARAISLAEELLAN